MRGPGAGEGAGRLRAPPMPLSASPPPRPHLGGEAGLPSDRGGSEKQGDLSADTEQARPFWHQPLWPPPRFTPGQAGPRQAAKPTAAPVPSSPPQRQGVGSALGGGREDLALPAI